MRKAALVLAVVVGAGGCQASNHHAAAPLPTTTAPTTTTTAAPPPPPPTTRPAPAPTPAHALVRFDSCRSFTEYLHARVVPIVTAYGVPGRFGPGVAVAASVEAASGTAGGSSAAGESSAAVRSSEPPPVEGDGGFSTTNNQETGIDEPDLVKTDGRSLFTLADQSVYAVDVAHPDHVVSSVPVPFATGLLLAGSRLLVLAPAADGDVAQTAISVVDIANPAAMTMVARVLLDGRVASARIGDGVARVVVESDGGARLPLVSPDPNAGRSERAALATNRAVVARSVATDWLPRYRLADANGTVMREGLASSCALTRRPVEFAGAGLVSVVTLDPLDPVPVGSASVLATAGTVYASERHLFVATTRRPAVDGAPTTPRPAVPGTVETELHEFDITDRTRARYLASGVVPGSLLNQYALSEYGDHLRVATTVDGPTRSGTVTVLASRPPLMVPVGAVGGLGAERNEGIRGVRFVGPRGFVVTFRQTDPLFALDLHDPSHPRVAGELHLPGYSAYLHPVSADRLLGIGHGADENGRLGNAKAALFDVSGAQPQLVDTFDLGPAMIEVERDAHAFLWWPRAGIAIVPIHRPPASPTDPPFNGAVVLRVSAGAIGEVGRVEHPVDDRVHVCCDFGVRRAAVVGAVMFTTSAMGVLASAIDDLRPVGWTAAPH